jgi:hypothetical protein
VQTKLRERPEGRRLFDLLRAGDVLDQRHGVRRGHQRPDAAGCP